MDQVNEYALLLQICFHSQGLFFHLIGQRTTNGQKGGAMGVEANHP